LAPPSRLASLTRQEPASQPSGWGDKALPAFESLDQLRDHLSGVTDDAEVRHREDRGVRILVDRDDRPRVLHADQVLHGPGDPDGDVDVGLDGLARLADLDRKSTRLNSSQVKIS